MLKFSWNVLWSTVLIVTSTPVASRPAVDGLERRLGFSSEWLLPNVTVPDADAERPAAAGSRRGALPAADAG